MGVILGLAVFLGILGFVQGFFFDGAKERRVKSPSRSKSAHAAW